MDKSFSLLFFVLFQLQVAFLSAADASPAQPKTGFKKFYSLRDAVTDKIYAAKQRVWLASEFVSDFDIALALYVAKSRDVDVRVIVSENRIDDFLSQYDYLAKHGVAIRTTAETDTSSHLLCDDELTEVNSDLDFLSDQKSFTLKRIKQKEAISVVGTFQSMFESALHTDQVAYDYTRKIHQRPNDIAHKLPSKTISNNKK